jgi:hypothetical protein
VSVPVHVTGWVSRLKALSIHALCTPVTRARRRAPLSHSRRHPDPRNPLARTILYRTRRFTATIRGSPCTPVSRSETDEHGLFATFCRHGQTLADTHCLPLRRHRTLSALTLRTCAVWSDVRRRLV